MSARAVDHTSRCESVGRLKGDSGLGNRLPWRLAGVRRMVIDGRSQSRDE